jgi:uncharacterized protein (TIGR03435 family)
MRAVIAVIALPLLSQAQTADGAKVEFDVAAIKLSDPTHVGAQIFTPGPGRLAVMTATLKDLVAFAYQVRTYQVTKGPGWFDAEKFDITAKTDEQATSDQLKLMLEALLADRFQLSFHREIKETPVYDLVVAKDGPKLKEVEKPGLGVGIGRSQLNGKGAPLSILASTLSDKVQRNVRDKTGLTGYYEFTLKWTPDSAPPDERAEPDLFTALREQIGLKLEPAKGPVEILVVDRAVKPTEN